MRTLPATLLIASLGAALVSPQARGATRPEIVAEVGGTAIVEGEPGQGGASVAAAVLWPLEKRFRLGLMGSVDDLGTRKARLQSPGGVDLGPIIAGHRAAQALGWRAEAHLPGAHGWRTFAAGTWGLYRVADDLNGDLQHRVITGGGGLGLGVLRRISGPHAAGIVARYQWLSRGAASRYLSAAAEWRWGSEAPE
jgi:hypothetical protein